jgi:hypothetical protein
LRTAAMMSAVGDGFGMRVPPQKGGERLFEWPICRAPRDLPIRAALSGILAQAGTRTCSGKQTPPVLTAPAALRTAPKDCLR